jgi:hypothetical protein
MSLLLPACSGTKTLEPAFISLHQRGSRMARTPRSWWRRWLNRLTPASRPRPRRNPWREQFLLEALEDRWLLSIFTVNSNADTDTGTSTSGTLRHAINQLNATGSTITEFDFAIGAVGSAQTISLTSALPAITKAVYINGLSQGGSGNTTPLIELNGAGAGTGVDGLQLSASGCKVSGLIIEGFILNTTTGIGGNGIEVLTSNNTIGGLVAGAGNVLSGNQGNGLLIDAGVSGIAVQGDFIGTNAAGTSALGNGNAGIEDNGGSNTIGGTASGEHNLISGNYNGIQLSAANDLVQGNFLGTNAAGTSALGNLDGVYILYGYDNTIGGTTATARNIISGNTDGGVAESVGVMTSYGDGNLIEGNYIGTDVTGTAAVPNNVGVSIGDENTIGGSTSGARNVISGNINEGIEAAGGVGLVTLQGHTTFGPGCLVQGNFIGTNAAGTAALGDGIGIYVSGANNFIGGTAAGTGNVISGNSEDGVTVDASGTQVQGNYIGTDHTGSNALGNSGSGVAIYASNTTIGGTAAGAGNVLSGNSKDGLLIEGGATVDGNYIGINAAGTAALGNSKGIDLYASNVTIGGTTSGARNIISGNLDGIWIESGVSGTQVQGNDIGTNAVGTSAVPNYAFGIVDVGSNDTIGGTTSSARNVISGNSGGGVQFATATSGHLLEGNYIGINAAGTSALANGSDGVEVNGPNDTIGGISAGAGNVVSANGRYGILIASSGTLVQGNSIGTNAAGTSALGNANEGILVDASTNTIGGTSAGARNVISGNGADGIDIAGPGTTVQGNYVGTNAAGTNALPNSGSGIEILADNNTIGGTLNGAGNVVSGNSGFGILIQSGSSGSQVQGNNIGTDVTGSIAVANQGFGVTVAGPNNTIGGSVAGARNVISGNSGGGVDISASGVALQGNYIGTNAAGTSALANSNDGVFVFASNDTVGGTATGAGNVISGNSTAGVFLVASDVAVQGNFIGTDAAGITAVGNGSYGVYVDVGSNDTIGGSVAGAGNVVSGNQSSGIVLATSGIVVQGNFIGTNAAGTAAVDNLGNGIYIDSSNDTIGGTSAGARNILSGNSYGVFFNGNASGVVVQGNFIGTNAAGTSALGNTYDGIEPGSNNTIGGTSAGAGNLISGNGVNGIYIGFSGVTVQGNSIGTNAAGTSALSNGSDGINILANNVTIGGTVAGSRNVISGNSSYGLQLGGSGLIVQGNYIGTNAAGTGALGNGGGVDDTAIGTTIGGSTAAARNLVSGNTGDGILVNDATATVQGNYIGTDVTGKSAVANGDGVEIAVPNFTLGSTSPAARNTISGNKADGVRIDGGASGVTVQGTSIGLGSTGGSLGNSIGVEVQGANNTIGGTVAGSRNFISGNTSDGVQIDSLATNNLIAGNFIGVNTAGNAALANGANGVEVQSADNTLGGASFYARNYISGNKGDGVLLDGGSNGNQVLNNFIGTDFTGKVAVGNGFNGIEVAGTSNTLGGTASGARNVISGNIAHGIAFDGSSFSNAVQGDYIGTNAAGNSSLANGTGVADDGSSNTIGGTATAARNIISGNSKDGVFIAGSDNTDQVQGNFIGLNAAGTAALPNSANGIESAGNSNTIGGTTPAARNIISGNNGDGVLLDAGASGNQVQGNYIGTNSSGTSILGNSLNGIEDAGTSNTVGSTAGPARNIVSGNGKDGVLLDSGASGNLLQGNFLGTSYNGTSALGNSGNGIEDAGTSNTVGGTVSGSRNVIAANNGDGVLLDATASNDLVQGNYIGTNDTGSAALGNSNGVAIQGSGNTLGGTVTAARNIISGNTGDGVLLASSGVAVQGNYIGSNLFGTSAIGNRVGVEIAASNAMLGATTASARNIISGNSNDGVLIDSSVSGVIVQGNYIGTNASGSAALGNSIGVEVAGINNTLGGSVSAASRNVISGNSGDGVRLDSTASGTTVQGNFIGLNAGGSTAVGNSSNGVEVQGANNTVGGTSFYARNYISGNLSDGVSIDSGVSGTQVQGNWIGLDFTGKVAVGNGSYGVAIAGSNNTVGGAATGASNSIANNAAGGVLVSSGSGNTIRHNSIFANGPSNTGSGITLSPGANNNLAAPSLNNPATLSGTTLTVTGTFNAPTANVTYVLEFFADPTGDPDGKVYLGAKLVKPVTTGTVAFTFTTTATVTGTNPVITATLTDNLGDTSAFSNGVTVS